MDISGPTQGSAASQKILIKPVAELQWGSSQPPPSWFLDKWSTTKGQEKLLKTTVRK